MADGNSVSDAQGLLQSMLQRLKLQTRPEINSTHLHDEEQNSSTAIERNGSAPESPPQTPPMYNFNLSEDQKSIVTGLDGTPSTDSTGPLAPIFPGVDVGNSHTSSTPKQRKLSWRIMNKPTASGRNSDATEDGVMPLHARRQNMSLPKLNDSSISSIKSVESSLASSDLSVWTESNIQDQGFGQKTWTQKLKEKWKDRNKTIPRTKHDERQKAESTRSPVSFETFPHENNTPAVFSEEVSAQHQPIENGPVNDIPGQLDHMSESLFSPGYFNLMEQIFTGQEWAKYLPTKTSTPTASRPVRQYQGMELTSSINRSCQNEQGTVIGQWNHTEDTDQMNSEVFYSMDTTDNGQYGLSYSGQNHLESMDLSMCPLGSHRSVQMSPCTRSNTIEWNVNPQLSSEESMNQLQMEINHNQPGTMHGVHPVLDLSNHQLNDGVCVKKQVYLSRKRGYATDPRGSDERWNPETGETNEWRHNSSSSDRSLSPAFSTSSLQHSQDSESSMPTEILIKKRRVENTRHVRFSEDVTFVPPLVLTDDDCDSDNEDYGHTSYYESNDEVEEEAMPSPSVPGWIGALRSKTKRKPKIKLPRMRTKKYKFV